MPYDLQLPNGVLLQDIPDDIPDSEVRDRVLKEFPDIAAKSKRTWGEAGTDVLASLGSGVGQLAQFPEQVKRLVTGERGVEGYELPTTPEEAVKQATSPMQTGAELGKRLEEYGQENKSAILKAREAARSQKIQEADGFAAEFGAAVKSTISDPALLSSFFFEQVPNLIGSYGFGALTKGGTKLLMRGATEEALAKAGVRGAMGGNAVMQGTDVGTDTYDQIYAQLKKERPDMDDGEAHGIALSKGRIAAIEAATISLGTSMLPGGSSVERAMLGKGLPSTGGFLKSTLGEVLSEGAEEGGGALAKNYNVQQVFPETDLMKGVGAATGLGALGGALLGGGANLMGGLGQTQGTAAPPLAPQNPQAPAQTPPTAPAGAAPTNFPDVPEFPAAPVVPEGPRVPPFTPLRTRPNGTPEGELERDLFGVVPEGRAVNPREMIGPEMPGAEEIARQQPIEFPGQQELFGGPSENAERPTFVPEPKAPEAKPIDIPTVVREVVDTAKQDPNAPKLLKANNPATAKIVSERIAQQMVNAPDPVQAIENLFVDHKTGKGKSLSDPQQELLEHTYFRLTGRQVEEGIKERAFMGAQQTDFFGPTGEPDGQQPAAPTPGQAGPDVGNPNEPNVPQGPAEQPEGGEPGGVARSPIAPEGPDGGAAVQPVALTPEQAWEARRNPEQPTFGELDPEEQAAWTQAVARNQGTGVNFARVMGGHTARNAKPVGKSGAEVKAAFDAHGKAMSQDIETDITGKNFNQVLQLLTKIGPEANREIAKKLMQRAKELVQHGYSFKFHVATTPAQARKADYGYGVLGRVNPDYFRKHMDISVAGINSGQPFGAQIRTTTHESLHAVTAMLVEYGERNPTSEAGKIVKELTKLSNMVRKHLEEKVARGERLTPAENKTLNGTNALGNSTGRSRYNQAHEMLAHGMTSEFMQEVLESIPYKGRKNLFSHFVDLVRQLLGVNARENTALSQVISLTEGLMGTSLAPIKSQTSRGRGLESVAPGPAVVPGLGQPYTLPRGTKLQPAQTAGQKVNTAVQKVVKAYNNDDTFTKFRIAAVDQFAGLSKTLSSLPVFANGKLRADMLLRSATQTINLIKNGLQSGIPVLNADGTVIIQRSADNLARTQKMADALDKNPIVKGTGMTGREYVAEVARHLRGEEIIQEDVRRSAKAKMMMAVAKQKIAEAKNLSRGGGKFSEVQRLVNEAKSLRAKFRNDVNLKREKQTTQAHIDWSKQQMAAVPELQQIFGTWRNINLGLIQLWEDTGKLTKEDADRLRSFKNYVPLYAAREDLAIDKQEGYTGAKTGTKSVRGIEYLEGSDLQRNIWENWDKHYASMTAAAFVNQTRKVAVEQLRALGAARVSGPTDDNVNMRYEDVNSPDADKNGIVHAIVDNPNDLAAFQAMHYELTPLMKGMSAVTQGLRTTALLNPMYWIKQLIRDPLHAALVTNTGITTPFHSASEFAKILAGQSEEAKLLATRGVIGQVDSTIDIHDFLKQAGTQKLSPSALDKAIHKIMQVHEASDAATRVSLFKKAKADGLKKGMSEAEATDYGVFVSRESINFGVRGNSKTLAAMRHMIPFLSASITSLDTVYRAATGYGLNPQEKAEMQRIFYSRAAMMTVLATVYAMSLQDDDDYRKLPATVKDNNWLLPNPWSTDGHSFIKIPVPFEIGFLFKTLPEASVRYLAGNATGKEMLASIRAGAIHNMPGEGILIPQAVKPALEAVTNYSFFTGRAIEGMSDQGLPVAQRGPNASEFAKMMSSMGLDTIGLSPAKIDHLIQGYMAELGTFSSSVASDVIAAADDKTPPTKNIEEKSFFKSFMTNPKTSSAATDFYEIAHTAQETVTDYNRALQRGDKEYATEIMSDEEKKKLYAIAPATRNLQNQMNMIRKKINYIKTQNDRDPDERRDEINELMRRYDAVARNIYDVMEKAGIER